MTALKKKTSEKSFNTDYAVNALGKIWDHWVQGLGYSEASAEKKMKSVITSLHKTETKIKKGAKKSIAKVKTKVAPKAAKKTKHPGKKPK